MERLFECKMARRWLHHPGTARRGGLGSLRVRGRVTGHVRGLIRPVAATLARRGHHRWLELDGLPRFPAGLTAVDHLAALREFTRQAGEATEPAEVLWRLCALCTETLGLPSAQVYLVGDAGSEPRLKRVGGAGDSDLWRNGIGPRRLDEVIAGYRQVLLLRGAAGADSSANGGNGGGAPRIGRREATAILPLRSGERLLALLAVSGRLAPAEWQSEAIPSLTPYLRQAAAALHYLLLQRESQQRVDRLNRILRRVSRALVSHAELTPLLEAVGTALVEVTGFDLAAVFLYDPVAERFRPETLRGVTAPTEEFWTPFAAAERLPGIAAASRSVVVELGIQRDDRPEATVERRLGLEALVSAPMVANEELVGILALGSVQARVVSREDMDVAQAVASQLSVAVGNVRLREQMRRRVEEQERASRELRLLYDTSRAVVETLALEDRLRTVARGLMQATDTTHCLIFRMERNSLAPWMSVGGTPEETRQFLSLDLAPVEVARLLRMMKARKAPFVAYHTAKDPFAASPWREALGIQTAVWLPLMFQHRITGAALVYRPGETREFSLEQLQLARAVSNQAAVAIRLSQAYEHERNIAVTLQRGLFPTVATRLQNFEIGHAYHPALQEAQVGGDIYDAFSLPDGRVALLMADVSGKGLPAAVQMMMLKHMLRAYAFEDPHPPRVFTRLNQALFYYTEPDLFVTAFYGVLSPLTGALTYSNAGHDCPLLYSADAGFCSALDTTGIALGMDVRSVYAERSLALTPGDVLLLYTDGVTEARGESAFFGRMQLEDRLQEVARARPSRIVEAIYRAVRTYSQGELHDDIALLVLKAKPSWKSLVRS